MSAKIGVAKVLYPIYNTPPQRAKLLKLHSKQTRYIRKLWIYEMCKRKCSLLV